MSTNNANYSTKEHPYDIAVAKGVEQGVILSDPSAGKLAELPPTPENMRPKDWVAYQCIRQVAEYMMTWQIINYSKACRETGWNYNTWRASRRNPIAMQLWTEEIALARETGLAMMRAKYHDIADAQISLASGTGPHSTRAAQWVSQELDRAEVETRAEAQRLRQGGKLSEAARLMAEADTVKVTATETTTVQVEGTKSG